MKKVYSLVLVESLFHAILPYRLCTMPAASLPHSPKYIIVYNTNSFLSSQTSAIAYKGLELLLNVDAYASCQILERVFSAGI